MLSNIRTSIVIALALICQFTQAADKAYRPVSIFSFDFISKARMADDQFQLSKEKNKGAGKICSCQILNLKSANYDHQHVALFAERTNDGNYSAESHAAKSVIEKEKKRLRSLFYDRLDVVSKISEATDCGTLYFKLKFADQSIVLYDILNADLQTRK